MEGGHPSLCSKLQTVCRLFGLVCFWLVLSGQGRAGVAYSVPFSGAGLYR